MRFSGSVLFVLALVFGARAGVGLEQGKIEIVGQGRASAEPEITTLGVTVISICYDTAREAQNANAQLANKIVDIMKSFARAPRDKVLASGGPSHRDTEYIQISNSERKILCERKWRTTNTLSLTFGDIKSLADVQDAVLTVIDAEDMVANKVSQTFAQLSQPSFGLHPETETRLRTEAQGAAYDDAKLQYETFRARCPFQNPRLTSISEPNLRVRAYRDDQAIGAHEATPIIPDEMRVTAVWKFIWSFDPTEGCFFR